MADRQPPGRGVVAVIPRDGRLLVIRRSQFVIAPRMLCFPGGGVRPGEEEPDAVQREIDEELGVRVAPLRELWRSVTPWDVALTWWLVDLPDDQELQPDPREVESVHWYRIQQLESLADLLASNRDFVSAWRRNEFSLPLSNGP